MGHNTPASQDFVISRTPARGASTGSPGYGLWRFDPDADEILTPMPLSSGAAFDPTHSLVPIGRYLLEWGPLMLQPYQPCFPYRLFEFDPQSDDPLNSTALQHGLWTKTKFWQYRPDFGNPEGAHEGYDSGDELLLLPLGGFMLNMIPTEGRGTFQLWNFDPSPLKPGGADPLPAPYTPQGSFDSIQFGHELIPLGNYVLDRVPETGEYWVWSFDPQSVMPLGQPAIQRGQWSDIDASHSLATIGDLVLDWTPADGAYRLWRFDPRSANPLTGPLRQGTLPEGLRSGVELTGIQSLRVIDPALAEMPGTIDFMRSKIKHVVYLMLENRSFDHVCGWLYGKGETGINFVGDDRPFDGVLESMFNLDPGMPDKNGKPTPVFVEKYKDGQLSDDWDLDFLPEDPYHDKSDVLRQLFYSNRDGYAQRATPDMGGFVWNNGVHEVMWTYSPEQLPVLNGLAKGFGVSDAWFSAMPGATDPNRAMAFTGSALGQLNNFQNGTQYTYWPLSPHRQSMWKVLWSNGFTDWKIYNSVEWMNFVHTYHLYLQGQIPSVDAAIAQNQSSFIEGIEQFKQDARAGKLPAFSMLEPAWIATTGTSSYHPGADLVPGEVALNEIYDALRAGPAWNETLFVITFDEHGGIFDHAKPPYAANPWPNDVNDGFRYDIMGVRVPTIIVSPWIKEKTVFRSPKDVAYDGTSFAATLLRWFGIPESRWCMGDRIMQAPTFEGVLQCASPRDESPTLKPPYDRTFPREGKSGRRERLHDLHRLMAPRAVTALAAGKLPPDEINRISEQILADATDLKSLHAMIDALAKRLA
ncbi:alkaline phosphatase family protein [Variovorax sp. YR216]|uniref:alkaline phosphatase family protein n=1 Tax=Variovorax sp. YR216 TaxID=1882828 RepID=UPI0008995E21|nr:alkaline phosphatase family protein [Variovorax sp. YR216]SDZ96251.1 Phospholipase C [Variovorax sp. YR216]